MWIGLTGSIGSGKSTVANLLREHGYFVIDADAIAHEGLKSSSPAYKTIIDKLSPSILTVDGEIDRRKLGQIIFSKPELKTWLEGLLHPMVQAKVKMMREQLEAEGQKLAFYEVPLLFEKHLESQFDKIIVVWVPETIQKQRLKKRNAWTDEEINQRNQSQWPINKKLEAADFKINNEGNLQELKLKVEQVLKKLKT